MVAVGTLADIGAAPSQFRHPLLQTPARGFLTIPTFRLDLRAPPWRGFFCGALPTLQFYGALSTLREIDAPPPPRPAEEIVGNQAHRAAFPKRAFKRRQPYRRARSRDLRVVLLERGLPHLKVEDGDRTRGGTKRFRPRARPISHRGPARDRRSEPMTAVQNSHIRNGLLGALAPDDLALLAPHLREMLLLPGDL